MKIFNELVLKFEQADWSRSPEFGLIDTILEKHPELFEWVAGDVMGGNKASKFGRKDIPTVEQIVRAAIYKELKGLDYRALDFHQADSRLCARFIGLNGREFSFQVYQKYISRITEESLNKLMLELNKIAISEGWEDVSRMRQDSTVVESNIHYPTNNSLVWDCIRESHRLLSALKAEVGASVHFRDYRKGAKRTYFKINVSRGKDKKVDLFNKQLITFTKCINQVSNAVKKKSGYSLKGIGLYIELERLLGVMEQVYSMTWRKEIQGESVPVEDKLFSIYELHTDIIVKGGREAQFGHKVNFATGSSMLVLDQRVLKGNVGDSELYAATIDRIVENYGIVPRDTAADGAYASKANLKHAQDKGIVNIVFNKVTRSLKNCVTSRNMETRLKKWRSNMEAVISNLKRGFGLKRCNWRGAPHFQAKVAWSVIAYNIRVMTSIVLGQWKKTV